MSLLLGALSTSLGADDIGFCSGVVNLTTANWELKIINASGVLASLKPAGNDFNFLPYDYTQLGRCLENGSYYWGDITLRYRTGPDLDWVDTNSAAARTPVDVANTNALAAHHMEKTMKAGPLRVTRE